jgi:maltose alpha-D-glucosyltransferase/alpha-amylase
MLHDRWDTHAVLDCLSVGPSRDAHGDGIGDCQGLLRRLDTLHGLGVTALWLLLFQPSPQGDDGAEYDGGAPRDGTHAREAAV